MSNIPKNNIIPEIPKMVELTEKEIKKRSQTYLNSLKDEDGLIEAIEKNIKKHNNQG